MIDFTWKIFSQTGNIETYLLLKELEKNKTTDANENRQQLNGSTSLNIRS